MREDVRQLNKELGWHATLLAGLGSRLEAVERGPRRPDGYIDSIDKLIQRENDVADRVTRLEARLNNVPLAPHSLPFHIAPTYGGAMDNAWSLIRTQKGIETTWCTDLGLPTACRLRDMLNKEFSA